MSASDILTLGIENNARIIRLTTEDGKIMVGVDFGTTSTGVSYSLRGLEVRGGEDNDHLIYEWPAANSRKITATKVASIVQYEHKTEDGIEKLVATRWGAQVLASKENCSSLFKPLLEPNLDRDHDPYAFWNSTVGHGYSFLPEAKEPSDVMKDYLDCVWQYSRKTIFKNTRQRPSYHPVPYTITVPEIWARETRKALEQIVKDAGLAL
ncbi:hypothetical protein BO85DRAFT_113917 [Aspergillus piperis CBS 112811]|uniref:Actin-like ATPase domain-containing protein n=1 Tax=Aspergillus piperis CBS 112811 TaxID=1448313 RepID=A0A8G1R7S7_9EURO|nr:hypothetical protein BO85DRAFT_113917 [Aspergillus piperis CBS 112811]RAH61661.1 hypothetical protein BO85DRAFT_113917 [Aspergillus piperis CBS 112811]